MVSSISNQRPSTVPNVALKRVTGNEEANRNNVAHTTATQKTAAQNNPSSMIKASSNPYLGNKLDVKA